MCQNFPDMVRVRKNSSLWNKTVIAGTQHLKYQIGSRFVNDRIYMILIVREKLFIKKKHLCQAFFSTSDFPKFILTNKPKLLIALILLDICRIICPLTSNSTSYSWKQLLLLQIQKSVVAFDKMMIMADNLGGIAAPLNLK